MNPSKPLPGGYQSRVWSSTKQLVLWGGAWVGTCALIGPKFLWENATVFSLPAIALNIAVGIGFILANKNYIMELDELQRKVYLNALAITVGVALIAAVPFQVMDKYRAIPFHANLSHLIVVMSVTFVVSVVYGNWRYR